MILYHGTNCVVDKIDLNKCRPYKDFGRGFYLTTIKEQAEKMAQRVSRIYGGKPVVNVFRYDSVVDKEINVKIFDAPTEEWARFVINNRSGEKSVGDNNSDNKYDIVIGPVANDDLALLFRQFSNGMIEIDTLIREMKYKKLTDQYSFHTEKALRFLTKESDYNV
ncbi:MAG: DUF3990 domain-containing protein [Acutalibacteraceae bacterium]